METQFVFILILIVLCADFVLERGLDYLNAKHMSPSLPLSLQGIYDEKEYGRFQAYQRSKGRYDLVCSGFSFMLLLLFFIFGGFGYYNAWIVGWMDNMIWQTVIFMLGLIVASSVLGVPFDYYATFRIEEKFGFNKMTVKTYWLDTVKELLLGCILGGVLLAAITWFYVWTGALFWIYAWGVVTLFTILMTMFYSRLIVPLFNKQTPLEEGSLREKIKQFAESVRFEVANIYVIDGSKRSTKANAYFTGLGTQKRIVLYDTLINELTEEEIVAVLAHEIGHYKKRHTLQFMVASVLQTGLLFWLFSLFVNIPVLSEALGGDRPYFQLGMVAFAILFGPVSLILGIGMNAWSRKNEYEADAFAARYYNGEYLISGLKKISVKALGNLTPYPLYESVYYSHPSLLKRIAAIEQVKTKANK